MSHEDAMSCLIREGSDSYLDALYALQRYRAEVARVAAVVWSGRHPDLMKAMGIERLQPGPLKCYYKPDGVGYTTDPGGVDKWGGNWAWVTAFAKLPEPTGCDCHIGLTFNREANGSAESEVAVAFIAGNALTASKLKSVFAGRPHFWNDGKECVFSRKPAKPLQLNKELDMIMDYVISIWNDLGGWARLPG